jgi:hypothetical protein
MKQMRTLLLLSAYIKFTLSNQREALFLSGRVFIATLQTSLVIYKTGKTVRHGGEAEGRSVIHLFSERMTSELKKS